MPSRECCGDRLPDGLRPHVERLAAISKWLRKEREFSFYGDVDFIPTEQYTEGDASRAIADVRFVVETVDASRKALPGSSHPGAQTPPDAGDAQQP